MICVDLKIILHLIRLRWSSASCWCGDIYDVLQTELACRVCNHRWCACVHDQERNWPKTILEIEKRDCVWGCARGINTTWENLQIEKHKSVRWAERTPPDLCFSIWRFSQVVSQSQKSHRHPRMRSTILAKKKKKMATTIMHKVRTLFISRNIMRLTWWRGLPQLRASLHWSANKLD